MRQQSLMGMVSQFLEDLRHAARLQLDLLDLEAQRAGHTLVLMLAFGIVAGLLLCFAWIGLCAIGVLWLVQQNCSISLALLMAVLLNLGMAVGLALAMRSKARYLSFPATRQNLGSGVLLFLVWRKLRRSDDA